LRALHLLALKNNNSFLDIFFKDSSRYESNHKTLKKRQF
jgi:hypothetical protein